MKKVFSSSLFTFHFSLLIFIQTRYNHFGAFFLSALSAEKSSFNSKFQFNISESSLNVQQILQYSSFINYRFRPHHQRCSAEAAKPEKKIITQSVTENSGSKPTIEIKPNSPADTVRAFYKHLREKKVREAIFLTNLRPAVEGLTDNELKELDVDFAALATEVPAEIQINGEIISGDKASVTTKLPDGASKKMKTADKTVSRRRRVDYQNGRRQRRTARQKGRQ